LGGRIEVFGVVAGFPKRPVLFENFSASGESRPMIFPPAKTDCPKNVVLERTAQKKRPFSGKKHRTGWTRQIMTLFFFSDRNERPALFFFSTSDLKD